MAPNCACMTTDTRRCDGNDNYKHKLIINLNKYFSTEHNPKAVIMQAVMTPVKIQM